MKPFIDWVEEENYIIRGQYNPITDESLPKGPLMLMPFQTDILGHVFTLNDEGVFPYTTVVYSTIKKSGKTTIGGAATQWFAEEAPDGSELFCLANDLEHAQGRAFADISFSVRENGLAVPTKSRVDFENGTYIQALAQEYKSAAGSRHCFTLWDELWGYMSDSSRRLWAEMTPIKIPGVPHSIRMIVTYAGFEGESELLWDLYETIVLKGEPVEELSHITKQNGDPVCWKNGRMFAYWDTEPRMPWQTEDYYIEQRATLRPHEYLRLHENRWVTTHEQFIPIEWYDEACSRYPQSLETDYKNERRRIPVVVGVDAGVARDSTAIVAVQYNYETGNVDQAFHKIRTPTKDERVDLETTVEKYILDMSQQFKISAVVYDPRHLVRSMQRIEKAGIRVVEYTQTLSNMVAASEVLYDLLRTQRFGCYPDDVAREHIKFAVAEEKGTGFRIVKPGRESRHHVDYAIALAMACHEAVKNHGVDVSKPLRIQHPDPDVSQWKELPGPDQEKLPEALRSDPKRVQSHIGWS